MMTKDFTLSIRVPAEAYNALMKISSENHTSLSEIARDMVMQALVDDTGEHVFLSLAQWAKSVKERDGYRCVECRGLRDLESHHIVPRSQGGKNVLSNGKTLCLACHAKAHTTERVLGEEIIHRAWKKKLSLWLHNYPDRQEVEFWKTWLACFYTQYKSPNFPPVQAYIERYLSDVDLETVKNATLRVCPTPELIYNSPDRWNNPEFRKEKRKEPPPPEL